MQCCAQGAAQLAAAAVARLHHHPANWVRLNSPFSNKLSFLPIIPKLDLLCVAVLRALPSSLLLLSRAFTVTQGLGGLRGSREAQLETLRDTLSSLPNKVIEQVREHNMTLNHLWSHSDCGICMLCTS